MKKLDPYKVAEELSSALSSVTGLDFGPFCAEEVWPEEFKQAEKAQRLFTKLEEQAAKKWATDEI